MSQAQKDKFDVFFKGFVMMLLMIIGFFASRSMNALDKATEDIELLKISTSVMKEQILNMNSNWDRVFSIENAKQKQHDDERFEDAIKK